MSKKEARKRAKKLREEVSYHDHRYYVLDDPEISDKEYDELKAELQAIEDKYPDLITPDSPTRRVGAEPREEFETIEHPSPMLSLQAVQEEDDIRHFYDSCVDKLDSIDDAVEWYGKMKEKREELPFEIDGCVFKVNPFDAQKKLGARAADPRWAIAWKFPPQRKVAKIKDIKAQVGRTGALTPVAMLEPVLIGGAQVSRVTLHNQDEIERKDIRKGDHVMVERAGDVIPHVVKVMKRKRSGAEKKYRLPRKCPACGGKVSRIEGEAVARCTNSACPARLEEIILHFASKGALDISGLGCADRALNQPAHGFAWPRAVIAALQCAEPLS